MTDPLLSWQVMKAAKEAAGRPGRDLFARINALSLFRIRDVPVSDQPSFSPNLSLEAYERAHDYLQLGMTHLYSMSPDRSTDVILETAGELLEKLYLDVPKETPERARELYNASLAYYLSGHYARAYVIMKGLGSLPGTSQTAALLRMMFLKDLPGMRQATTELLTNPEYSDAELEQSLLQGEITVGEATERIMQVTLNRAFSMFLEYARSGQGELIEKACALLETGIRIAIDQELFEWWWLLYCSVALLREYKRGSLWKQLQQMLDEDQSGTVQAFIQGCFYQPNPIIELWRSQANAVPFINDPLLDAGGRSSYCVKMPTSAGKTRIAEIAILRFLVDCAEEPERKCLYIAPYRALAAEVESNLKRSFDPLGIRTSELYGGFFIDPTEAQMFDKTRILVATPEKTDAFLRHNDKLAKEVGLVIIDEGHIIDSGTRGLRYEFFLHRLVRRFADRGTRLIFISAVMPKVEQFTVWITNRKPDDGLITSNWRASRLMLGVLTWDGRAGRVDYLYQGLQKINVPMFFGSFMSALVTQQALAVDGFRRLETERGVFPTWGNRSEIVALAGVESVLKEGPTLIFASQPDFVDSIAQSVLTALALGSSLFCWNLDSARLPGRVDPEALQMLQNCIRMAGEMTGSNSLVVKALKAGFIVHHGGIPKLLRTQLECLARAGVVRLTIATNTLAQGVNLPVRIILIHSLAQGAKRYVPATDFWNICGRAGRAMHENEGAVFILADETSPSPANFVTAKAQAQWLLKKYVREGQSQTLVSAIRHFLEQVVHAWQKEYPEADVGELCQHLADDKVDWLPENERHQLEVLDAQLLALLEETENAETTPEFVEKLLERSLLLIQLNQAELGEPLTTRRAVGILTARIQHVSSSVPASQLRQYYRTGLTLSDCHFLKRHLTEIKQAVLEACHFMEWSPQQRSDYLAI